MNPRDMRLTRFNGSYAVGDEKMNASERRIQMVAKHLERRFLLGPQSYRLQGIQSLAEQTTLIGKRNVLFHSGPKPKKLAYLVKCTAEARGRREAPKPT